MIDDHCHPFALRPAPGDLDVVTLDVRPGAAAAEARRRHRPTYLWDALLRSRLSDHLGCDPEEVAGARTAAAAADYRGYVRGLFADAGMTDLVLDPAWPPGSAEHADEFADLSGCRVHLLFRVDTLVDELLTAGEAFPDLLTRFDAALASLPGSRYVGLKTVLAYRTGLAVQPGVSERAAGESLSEEAPLRGRAKPLRDFLLQRALRFAAEAGLPLQIHTGFGDSDLRLSAAHPLALEDLLATPEGATATVVLIHGSFPYHEEAAYLAVTHPKVFVDFSLFPIFAPALLPDRLLRLVELAPTAKVLAGTDGFAVPEAHWFAAKALAGAWDGVRSALAHLGAPDSWLDDTTAAVFGRNAAGLYRLDER